MADSFWFPLLGPLATILGTLALIELSAGMLRLGARAAAGETVD